MKWNVTVSGQKNVTLLWSMCMWRMRKSLFRISSWWYLKHLKNLPANFTFSKAKVLKRRKRILWDSYIWIPQVSTNETKLLRRKIIRRETSLYFESAASLWAVYFRRLIAYEQFLNRPVLSNNWQVPGCLQSRTVAVCLINTASHNEIFFSGVSSTYLVWEET